VICEVGTDSSSYKELCCFPGTPISFSDMNFEKASLSPAESFTVPISEKEKGWVEKQITLYSKDFNAPIGIYNIAYRFRVTGRVKTKKYKQ
jgi:hypothetical protein